MQSIAIAGSRATAAEILRFSQLLDVTMKSNHAAISPLVGDCLYMGAATYAWLAHETGAREMGEAYHAIRKVLETLASRWAVGHQYLAILTKSRETTYAETLVL